MEHVERAGVHSGDSISVYPPQKIKPEIKQVICDYTQRLAKALHVIGLINIQFIVYEDEVYVIEVNPRSSRTIPYISKVTDIPVVDVATKVIMGHSIKDQGYEYGLQPEKETVAVKMPVFSFEKIKGAEISLGPEMKSTGEVLGSQRHLTKQSIRHSLEQVSTYQRERISSVQSRTALKKNSYQSLSSSICLDMTFIQQKVLITS